MSRISVTKENFPAGRVRLSTHSHKAVSYSEDTQNLRSLSVTLEHKKSVCSCKIGMKRFKISNVQH